MAGGPQMPGLCGGDAWLHPSPKLAKLRRAEVAGASLLTGLVALVLGVILVSPLLGVSAAAGLLVAGAVTDSFVQRRVRAWAYCEREDDLVVSRGVLISRVSVVPYGRMQFVDVVAGPIERSYGLATVRMHTAAAASDARIPGLGQAEAARLRDQLSTLGQARAAGL